MQVTVLLTLIRLLAGEGVETCLDINNRRHRTMHDRTMMLEFAAVCGRFRPFPADATAKSINRSLRVYSSMRALGEKSD